MSGTTPRSDDSELITIIGRTDSDQKITEMPIDATPRTPTSSPIEELYALGKNGFSPVRACLEALDKAERKPTMPIDETSTKTPHPSPIFFGERSYFDPKDKQQGKMVISKKSSRKNRAEMRHSLYGDHNRTSSILYPEKNELPKESVTATLGALHIQRMSTPSA